MTSSRRRSGGWTRARQKVAHVFDFDFGDEWRVLLTVKERVEDDGGAYPRVLERHGEAPPQYADDE